MQLHARWWELEICRSFYGLRQSQHSIAAALLPQLLHCYLYELQRRIPNPKHTSYIEIFIIHG